MVVQGMFAAVYICSLLMASHALFQRTMSKQTNENKWNVSRQASVAGSKPENVLEYNRQPAGAARAQCGAIGSLLFPVVRDDLTMCWALPLPRSLSDYKWHVELRCAHLRPHVPRGEACPPKQVLTSRDFCFRAKKLLEFSFWDRNALKSVVIFICVVLFSVWRRGFLDFTPQNFSSLPCFLTLITLGLFRIVPYLFRCLFIVLELRLSPHPLL